MPLKLVVLTDLHLVPVGEEILGIDPSERLTAALEHIVRHHGDADRLIITGDLTHYGDEASYLRLRQSLNGIDMPVTLMLGNHDRRSAFRRVFPTIGSDADGFVQTIIDCRSWRLVCLDTLSIVREDEDEIDDGSGDLCHARLAWLDAALATAGGRPVLLFLHHPPHAVGFRGMDQTRLKQEAEFFALLERYQNVRHIFCGHIHRTISGSTRGIPFSIFKSPVHQQPMTFDSDDTSLSVIEPAAYGIVFARNNSVLVHTEDYELCQLDTVMS